MQNAETVLNVIRERGERGLPLENIYRLLYNRNLYLRAYGRIASNQGATTKGVTAETMDGMSLAKIDRIIEALRYERFRWTPVRRVNIPKPNGTTRALGIPTGPDKLLQEVIRMILEAYYEPQFSDRSHGFRPDRGCHTALSNVTTHWTGVRWVVEGDIKGCFDNIDHEVLLSVLGEKLHDNRFLRLLKYLLKAGYVEDWKYGRTLSGTPQGGIVSPILANIYLDRLDKFVENVLIPAHTRGSERRDNREYTRLLNQAARQRKRGNHAEALQLRKQMQQLPSRDPYDPGYRRLRYVRYADDFVLGFIGPKVEAQQVKESLETFLHDTLKLELSREKTLITHATSQAARFLGYELVNQQANDQLDRNGRRRVNGQIGLRVPANVIEQHCQAYMRKGKPAHRSYLLHDEDFGIVAQAIVKGFLLPVWSLQKRLPFIGRLQHRSWLSPDRHAGPAGRMRGLDFPVLLSSLRTEMAAPGRCIWLAATLTFHKTLKGNAALATNSKQPLDSACRLEWISVTHRMNHFALRTQIYLLPVGVPGRRQLLPSGLQRLPFRATAIGHGDVVDTDPCGKTQVHRTEDATPVQERRGNRARAARLSQGCQAQGQRQATSRGIFRWHTPETATAGSPSRPTASTVQERPQRAYQTARSGRVRDVRVGSGRRSSPHPRPSRPERERPTGKAQVGTNHGGAKTQDSRGLPDMSHGHPPRAQ